jgi:hypothetical protein
MCEEVDVILTELGPGPLDNWGILHLGYDTCLHQVYDSPVRELYNLDNRSVVEHRS